MQKEMMNELKVLAKECRLYANGKRPEFSLQRVAKALDSLSDSLDDTALSSQNPLTKREFELLELIALGYTNRELAGAFKISEKTIEFHLTSILKKTGASKRAEAVSNAYKNKWLSTP